MSDLISREEAVRALGDAHFKNYGTAIMVIRALPSDDFVEYLLGVISPNEMEMYRKMYEEREKYNG